ncbi:MAG: cytochrome c oxidase subunit 3 [Bacteroidia bacterium]
MDSTVNTMEQERKVIKQKAERNLLWLGIFSIIMIFGGLTSAYVVRRGAGDWFSIVLPQVFWISTAILLFSSATINFSIWAYRKNNKSLGNLLVGITLILGIVFSWLQFEGYEELIQNGIFLSPAPGQSSLVSGSFIYVLSGLHLAHLGGGLIALIFTLIKGFLGRYNSENVHGVRLAAIYWHFLDALWIYLFLFLTIFK